MGYTHYWTINEAVTPEQFKELGSGVLKIVNTANEAGIELNASFTAGSFDVNGVGAGEHETFFFGLDTQGFNFCKTAQKPYDAVVTASLILAKKIFGDSIEVKSDGNWVDWSQGAVLFEQVFGYEPQSILGESNG